MIGKLLELVMIGVGVDANNTGLATTNYISSNLTSNKVIYLTSRTREMRSPVSITVWLLSYCFVPQKLMNNLVAIGHLTVITGTAF
jgi:hypothetical protein